MEAAGAVGLMGHASASVCAERWSASVVGSGEERPLVGADAEAAIEE